MEMTPAVSGAFLDLPFSLPVFWFIVSCSGVVCIRPFIVLVLGELGRGFVEGKCQILPITSLGLRV